MLKSALWWYRLFVGQPQDSPWALGPFGDDAEQTSGAPAMSRYRYNMALLSFAHDYKNRSIYIYRDTWYVYIGIRSSKNKSAPSTAYFSWLPCSYLWYASLFSPKFIMIHRVSGRHGFSGRRITQREWTRTLTATRFQDPNMYDKP